MIAAASNAAMAPTHGWLPVEHLFTVHDGGVFWPWDDGAEASVAPGELAISFLYSAMTMAFNCALVSPLPLFVEARTCLIIAFNLASLALEGWELLPVPVAVESPGLLPGALGVEDPGVLPGVLGVEGPGLLPGPL